jgi:hypothetical protein
LSRQVCRRCRQSGRHPFGEERELLRPGREPVELEVDQGRIETHQALGSGTGGHRPAVATVGFADGVIERLVVQVAQARAVVNAVDGDRELAPDEFVEQRVAPIAAVGDPSEGGVLPPHTETRVPHHEHEESRLALREAVIGHRLHAFRGGQSNISAASPP